MGCRGLQIVQIMRKQLVERRICLPDLDVVPVALVATPPIIQVLFIQSGKSPGERSTRCQRLARWENRVYPTPAWTWR
jgi:hypothetical protein